MRLTPDELILWHDGFFKVNGTIAFTWGIMLLLVLGSFLLTRKLPRGGARSRWQNLLEIAVTGLEEQIGEVGLEEPRKSGGSWVPSSFSSQQPVSVGSSRL